MTQTPDALDLGRFDAPLLFFGGPLSNLAATRAMREQAQKLGFPPERVICTGDIVAYCAEPVETVELVRDWGIAVVQGNCEESLGEESPDCGCGFEEGTVCSRLSADWYDYANRRIDSGDRAWMRTLPRAIRLELANRSILVVHGGVAQNNRFIFPGSDDAQVAEELEMAGTDLIIGGHSCIPSGRRIGPRSWLNVGAIGLPANDGTPDGWYLVLSPEQEGLHCDWHRLPYPAVEAGHAMYAAGLTDYARTLVTGLWPSMDVLPAADRARQGIPLQPQGLNL